MMKRIIGLMMLCITVSNVHAQTKVVADQLQSRKTITLKTRTITDIQADTAFSLDSKVPTSKAVKDFIIGRIGDIAGGAVSSSQLDSSIYQLTYPNDSMQIAWHWDGRKDTSYLRTHLVFTYNGGCGDSITINTRHDTMNFPICVAVDSLTVHGDSLFTWKAGVPTFVTNLATAAAGGDTTIFEIVLDSTGNNNDRLLFSRNKKISSSPRLLFDSANAKVVINMPNVSVGGASTKLFVGGNTVITGQLTIQTVPTTIDSTLYKPLVMGSDGIIRRRTNWPSTGGGGGGTPAGSNTQIQFNNSGSFGASSTLSWDGTQLFAPRLSTGTGSGLRVYYDNQPSPWSSGVGLATDLFVQSFAPAAGGYGFTWNSGGGLQTPGTNELMKLTTTGALTVNGSFGLTGNATISGSLTIGSALTMATVNLTTGTGIKVIYDPQGAPWGSGVGIATNGYTQSYSPTATGYGFTWNSGGALQTPGTNELMKLTSEGALALGTTTPDASAILNVSSTTKGFLPPRMTTSERTGIASPAEGLCVYDLTLHKLYVYDGTTWQAAW